MLDRESYREGIIYYSRKWIAFKASSAASVKEKTSSLFHRPIPTTTLLAKKAISSNNRTVSPELCVSATVLFKQKCVSSIKTLLLLRETASKKDEILGVAYSGCPAYRMRSWCQTQVEGNWER